MATKAMLGQLNALAWGAPPAKSESTTNRSSFGSSPKSEKKGESANTGSGMGYAVADSRSGNKDFDFDFFS